MQQRAKPSNASMQALKSKLFFVLAGIVIFRVGAHVPVPGVDLDKLSEVFNQHQGGMLGLFNMFSGGSLSRLTVFALGVMPYISASIIMQLMSVSLPTIQQLKKEGDRGRRKINRYTRFLTLFIGFFQAVGITKWLAYQHISLDSSFSFYAIACITLTTGTIFLMWLGEQMTEHGIGNGVSLLIFAGIVSRFPGALGQIVEQVHQGQMHGLTLILLAIFIAVVLCFVVYMERAQRRIPITHMKKQRGNKLMGGHQSHLPLKINMAGVIPPIFASSIILLPTTLANFFGHGMHMPWLLRLDFWMAPGQPLYIAFTAAAIIFFSFFYTALVFNPKETADNLKKSGALIPGIRPGGPTKDYINAVMERLTLSGSIYLCLVALLPQFLIMAWHVPFYFGGTSLLIVVVVLMDFITQVQTHLMTQKYQSLMKGDKQNGASNLGLLH